MARKRFGAGRLPCPALPCRFSTAKSGKNMAINAPRPEIATVSRLYGHGLAWRSSFCAKNNIKRLTPAGFHDNGKKKPKNRQSSDMQVTIQEKLPKGGCAGVFCPGAVRWRDHSAMTLGVRVIDPPRPMHGQARLR